MYNKITIAVTIAVVAFTVSALKGSCGSPCPFGNNDCADSKECSRCDGPGGFNGVCAKGLPCGNKCGADGDCDQLSDCNLCIGGKCVAGCLNNCSTSSQCGAPCSQCIDKKCEEWSCGKSCTNSSDCPGPCAQCVKGKCLALCGGPCLVAADCDASACPFCTNGKCTSKGTCGATCATDAQCADKDCNQCISGKCASGCNGNCTSDSQCGDKNCGRCLGGKCAPWTCGLTCDPSKGGVCAGNCALCLSSKCYAMCNSTCFADADCPGAPFKCSKCTNKKCVSA